MKIVQFLHGNQLGGMEKFCIDLANALSKQHEVMFLGSSNFEKFLDQDVKFVTIDMKKSRNSILFLYGIYKNLKRFKPDIIHVHKQKSIQVMNRLKYFLNIPFIATKHDTQIKKAFHGLKYAITISEEMRETIQAEKVFKIYNGIPYYTPKIVPMPDTFNIVAVGGLRKVKGYDLLIQHIATLNFDYHLTIIGEGNEREHLQELIDKLGLEKNTSLVGFKSNVNDYLYSADLQVISSLSEGFSLAMIEGLFYSKILISTKISGCKEILSDELLIDIEHVKDTIHDIKNNYDRYQKAFQDVKQQYSEALTISSCIKEHEKIYLQVIEDAKVSSV